MNTSVDNYFVNGCGRCSLANTPACKVHTWPGELAALRALVQSCGLTEESKWGVPCYTFQGKNVLIVSAFKEYCSLSFFKGALLQDSHNILQAPGENSQASRQARFTQMQQIDALHDVLKSYVFEAIEIEKEDRKIVYKKEVGDWPEELLHKCDEMPLLKTAFEALTPGRQRGYLLFFAQAKQSKTRKARIEKCIPSILAGRGLNDY